MHRGIKISLRVDGDQQKIRLGDALRGSGDVRSSQSRKKRIRKKNLPPGGGPRNRVTRRSKEKSNVVPMFQKNANVNAPTSQRPTIAGSRSRITNLLLGKALFGIVPLSDLADIRPPSPGLFQFKQSTRAACPECRGLVATIANRSNRPFQAQPKHQKKEPVVSVFRGAEFVESPTRLASSRRSKAIDINVPFERIPEGRRTLV